MAGIGIGLGLGIRPGGGGSGGPGGPGGGALTASGATFVVGTAAGGPIATLRDPFADGGTTGYASFGTVPAQLALAGGSVVAGAGAAVVGSAYAIGVLATSGDGRRKVGETLVFTAQAAAGGGSAPAALLMTGRAVPPGFQGYVGSDGVDGDSNSRLAYWNETGAGVTRLRACFPNWMATAISESDAYNPIQVQAALEYPAGTIIPLTFGGAATATIANGALVESDEIPLPGAIPADAQFWIRTHVAVAAGGRWPQGYQIRTTAGEAADFATGIDRSQAGTITNAAPTTRRRGYGPAAITATGYAGTPRTVALALVGDSTVMGSTDGSSDARGNTGYPARACMGVAPALNLGIAGTKVADNLGANYARRLDLIRRAGITHVYSGYSQNDIAAGRSLATMQANLTALWTMFAEAGLKVVQATSLPRSTSGDGFTTMAGQAAMTAPAGAFDGGAGSRRSQLNTWIRGVPGPLHRCFDVADSVEPSRDAGIWRAGEGSVYLTAGGGSTDAATTDGIHPSVTGVNRGGVFVARDAMAAALAHW